MAENALYLSSVQHQKPTIFELIAQESLMKTLQPSYTLFCKFLQIKCEDKLKCFFKYQEEWYLVLNLLLQSHYLRLFKGSFAEVFYGLKRVPLSNNSRKLSTYSRLMTLFCLVGLPFLSLKIKRFIDNIQLRIDADNISSLEKKVYHPGLSVFKSLNTFYEILKLYYLIIYLGGYTDNHSPLLRISGVKLVYNNIQEPSWRDLVTDYFKNKRKVSSVILPLTIKFCSQFLEISAFTIQFLNWWHSDEVKTKLNSVPIPPALDKPDNSSMLCPICKKKRKVEVVLQSSGYVFCYRCIKDELEKKGKCPITKIPATTDQLIRIIN